MGCGPSKKTFKSQSTKVNIFLHQARQEIQNGNLEKVQGFYEKAINASESDDDKSAIRKEMSTISVTKIVPKPKLVKQSTFKTKSFRESCNTLVDKLDELNFPESSAIITEQLLKTDLRQVKSIKTYFIKFFDLVMEITKFQSIDDGSDYQLKENILILLKDLAYTSLHNNKAIVIDESTHKNMLESIETHVKWLSHEEKSGISYTLFYFHLSYIQDIVSLMKSTKDKVHKETKDALFANASGIIGHCLALNISGVLENAASASITISKAVAQKAIEYYEAKIAERRIFNLVKSKALAEIIIPLNNKNDPSGKEALNLFYESFSKLLTNTYRQKPDNWKLFVQLVHDTGRIVESTNDPIRAKLLIDGNKEKGYVGLKDFSTFKKTYQFSNSWRIRERTMIVSIRLLKHGKDLNQECQESLQAILQACFEVRLEEPQVIRSIFTNSENLELMTKEINISKNNVKNMQKNVANLIGQYSSNTANDMKEMYENCDAKKKKILKRQVTSDKSQMKKMASALLNTSSKNKYLKIQANRLYGDEAYATGDYRDAITFYLKWKEDTIEANNGNESCADLMSVFVKLGDVYEMQGEYETSMEYLKKALPMQVNEFGTEEHADVGETYRKMGKTCSRMGTYDQAMEYCMKSLKIRLKVLDEGHVDAMEYCMKSLKIRLEVLDEGHVDVGESYYNLGRVTCKQGKYEEALDCYNKALTIRINKLGEDHPDVAGTYIGTANVYESQGKYEEALDHYNKSLTIRINKLGEDHPDVGSSYWGIALVYEDQ
eukprot:g2669.t1